MKLRTFFTSIGKAAVVAVACPVILRDALAVQPKVRYPGIMEQLAQCDPITKNQIDLSEMLNTLYALARERKRSTLSFDFHGTKEEAEALCKKYGFKIEKIEAFTCPDCGRTSHHPEDKANQYCGNCHEFKGGR
jgi:hypothetical protein